MVVLTAHGDVARAASVALKNGAFDFLEKPIDEVVLIDALRDAMRADRERRSAATSRSSAEARFERLTGHSPRPVLRHLPVCATRVALPNRNLPRITEECPGEVQKNT